MTKKKTIHRGERRGEYEPQVSQPIGTPGTHGGMVICDNLTGTVYGQSYGNNNHGQIKEAANKIGQE